MVCAAELAILRHVPRGVGKAVDDGRLRGVDFDDREMRAELLREGDGTVARRVRVMD